MLEVTHFQERAIGGFRLTDFAGHGNGLTRDFSIVASARGDQIDEVLNEVVPLSIRGPELTRMLMRVGSILIEMADYEHVTITEPKNAATQSGLS